MASLASNFGKPRRNTHGRTKAVRRKATEEGTCVKRDIVYQREIFKDISNDDIKPLGQTRAEVIKVNDCFLKGAHFIDDNAKDVIVAQSLLNMKKKPMNIDYFNLPIYVINAHSADEFFIELVPPEDMDEEKAEAEREYSYDNQIAENFTIKGVSDGRRSGFDTRSNFFKTKPDSGVFVIQGAPTGYDAKGCHAESKLKKIIAQEPNVVRDILLNPEFSSFLPRINESFVQSIYMPPGYSIINKGYQFWEHAGESTEPWGILCLSNGSVPESLLKRMPLYYTNLIHRIKAKKDKSESIKRRIEARPIKKTYSTTPVTVTDYGAEYTTNYPQLHPNNVGSMDESPSKHKRMRRIIEKAIRNKRDVSLKTIVETMGPGIYLDMGCASISLKMWDPSGNGRFRYYGLDHKKETIIDGSSKTVDSDGIQPLYNVIYDDLDTYTYNLKLAWNNIVQLINENMRATDREEYREIMADEMATLMGASKRYAEQAYHSNIPIAQKRAQQNNTSYMEMEGVRLNNMSNTLKLPSLNQLGAMTNSMSIGERTKKFRSRKKNNTGGRRKKTRRRKKKRKKRKTKRRKK